MSRQISQREYDAQERYIENTAYGRTPLGQFLYDLGFTKLSDAYLARKHKQPVAEIRRLRALVKNELRQRKKRK